MRLLFEIDKKDYNKNGTSFVRPSVRGIIIKDGKIAMVHSLKCNYYKFPGGGIKAGEEHRETLLREVKEETGYTLTDYRYRGLVTFVSGGGEIEYMSLFTADGFEGEPIECDEGVLEWVPIVKIGELNLWEGDKIFFRLLEEGIPFFSLKLVYDGYGKLESAALNGKPMQLQR